MKSTIVNAVLKNLEINKTNLKTLIDSLPENQRESALEILLGVHPYQNVEINSTKSIADTEGRIYTKPLQLLSVDLIKSEVNYRMDYYNIPYRYYKSEEDFNSEDYKTYSTDKYTIKRIAEEDKRPTYDHRSMSIEEWMTK